MNTLLRLARLLAGYHFDEGCSKIICEDGTAPQACDVHVHKYAVRQRQETVRADFQVRRDPNWGANLNWSALPVQTGQSREYKRHAIMEERLGNGDAILRCRRYSFGGTVSYTGRYPCA
ncbi:hypothetical protein PG997_001230 [Apiospora hydei]|uniref:Uncharacterized protein n=1 Tax=Apiospora hydei TaxID=1337664 RepID=A0ABR1XD15_9PEZI